MRAATAASSARGARARRRRRDARAREPATGRRYTHATAGGRFEPAAICARGGLVRGVEGDGPREAGRERRGERPCAPRRSVQGAPVRVSAVRSAIVFNRRVPTDVAKKTKKEALGRFGISVVRLSATITSVRGLFGTRGRFGTARQRSGGYNLASRRRSPPSQRLKLRRQRLGGALLARGHLQQLACPRPRAVSASAARARRFQPP